MIRAFFDTAKITHFPTVSDIFYLKVFYPGVTLGSEREKTTLVVPAAEQKAPFPVVIFFNGYNCEAFVYQWLAEKLAERGLVVVTFNWIAEEFRGNPSITPGVDFAASKSDVYGTKATAVLLATLLGKLEDLQEAGILAGLLDLQRIVLGGHSAGGRVAVESANSKWFGQVAASFGYGVHSMGTLMQGYQPGTILPLPDKLPMLLMGGTNDGVIANSSGLYGIQEGDATTSIMRTFQEAIVGGRDDSYVVFLNGANHYAITHPLDSTTSRSSLDFPSTSSTTEIRSLMSDIIGSFIDVHVKKQPDITNSLPQLLNTNSLVNFWQCK
jgi:dienelactone hydrolase